MIDRGGTTVIPNGRLIDPAGTTGEKPSPERASEEREEAKLRGHRGTTAPGAAGGTTGMS